MGIYSEYLALNLDFNALTKERKSLLSKISNLRGNRDILVYASDLNKNQAPISIDYSDIMPFQDQLANMKGNAIDIILETPGGFAEVVEDLVKLVRSRYEHVGIIVPGYSKSAGTIFAMAGDEILMGTTSALGPIDAQIIANGKRFSAEAFLDGLRKIKDEVQEKGLNLAYVPMLQNISPGEIQHCENAQYFSQKLVSEWLAKYKFKKWLTHSSNGLKVTAEDKVKRANEIGAKLCSHSAWLTHGRSIKIEDFINMKLEILDYSKDAKLNDVIIRYYTLLRMTFDQTGIYKIFETPDSQVMRFISPQIPPPKQESPSKTAKSAKFNFVCPKCNTNFVIQANLESNVPIEKDAQPYPVETNMFNCPKCSTQSNLVPARLQIEAQSNRKIVN